MKKLIFIGLLLAPLNIHSSVISSKSPWGCVPVWPYWIVDTLKRGAYYDTVLDSAVSCGMSWIRPPLAPSDNFNPSIMDPFVKTVNRHSVNCKDFA